MATKKTWTEKFSEKRVPIVKKIDFPFAGIPAGSTMLIATPEIINAYIRNIPRGKSVTVETMRKDLAIEYGAEYTCPVTTGIFTRIVAEASLEKTSRTKSTRGSTPFWRVVDPKSILANKLSCGSRFVKEQRDKEKIAATK